MPPVQLHLLSWCHRFFFKSTKHFTTLSFIYWTCPISLGSVCCCQFLIFCLLLHFQIRPGVIQGLNRSMSSVHQADWPLTCHDIILPENPRSLANATIPLPPGDREGPDTEVIMPFTAFFFFLQIAPCWPEQQELQLSECSIKRS